MRLLRVLAVAIAMTGLAAVGVATDRPVSAGRAGQVAARPATVSAVCPDVSGRGQGFATRLAVALPGSSAAVAVQRGALGTRPSTRRITVRSGGYADVATRAAGPVAVSATGPAVASLAGAQISIESHGSRRGLAGTPCVRPAADWWFLGADGRVGYDDVLYLSNPGPAPATVSVSLLSSSAAPVTAPSLASITVHATGVTRVAIPKVAPNVPNLAVHVRASDGLVAASLLDARIRGVDPQGSDWLPATGPGTRVVVPALPAGPGSRELLIANPGRQPVAATIELSTQGGSFAPNGHSRIDIPGRQTVTVDLRTALQRRRASVIVTAASPVLAAAASTATERRQLPDLVWTAGGVPLAAGDTWAQVWSGEGRDNDLWLVAPGDRATVTVRDAYGATASLPVPARTTTVTSLASALHARGGGGPGWVTVVSVSGGPVYGVQVVQQAGAHGPLITALPPTVPPGAIRLPAVEYDQAIAVKP